MNTAFFYGLDELQRDPYMRAVRAVAAAGGLGPFYLVGGYLRDLLLHRPKAKRIDLDLVIWGDLERFGRDLAISLEGSCIHLDPEMIRVVARLEGMIVQIDINRPTGRTIEEDLTVRDFTVNAMAVHINTSDSRPLTPDTLRVIDPTGGLNDLRETRLRAITPSAFDRDPLRLIRAVRLAAELNFSIEEITRQWMTERASLLGRAAGERLRAELFKILDMVPAATWIERLDALQLLKVLVPEIEALKSVPASTPHCLPLWEHSLETLRSIELLLRNLQRLFPEDALWLRDRLDQELEAGVTEAAILKLLGFLHDIGKPETRSLQPNGRVRFIGHEQAGLPILTRLCERLRLGRRARSLVIGIEQHHLRPIHLSRMTGITVGAQYRFFRNLGDVAPVVLLHSWADLLATIGEATEEFNRHQEFLREIFRFYRTAFLASRITPIVRGDDLIEIFGVSPGPFLGFALERLQEAQATGLIGCREEALAYTQEHLISWQHSFFEVRPS